MADRVIYRHSVMEAGIRVDTEIERMSTGWPAVQVIVTYKGEDGYESTQSSVIEDARPLLRALLEYGTTPYGQRVEVPPVLAKPDRCPEREGGGVQCAFFAGHEGDHAVQWAADEDRRDGWGRRQ